MNHLRFRLRSILLAVTIIAIALGGIAWVWNWLLGNYYVQVHRVRSALAEHPEIEKVWVSTNNDLELEMELLFFTVKGNPRLILGTNSIDGASKEEISAEIQQAIREQRPARDVGEPWRWGNWK